MALTPEVVALANEIQIAFKKLIQLNSEGYIHEHYLRVEKHEVDGSGDLLTFEKLCISDGDDNGDQITLFKGSIAYLDVAELFEELKLEREEP